MQRVHGPQTPFESYCYACRVTFPVEGKYCVHCGGRLARMGQARPSPGEPHAALAAGMDGMEGMGGMGGSGEEGLEEEEGPYTIRRFGGLIIWALVALSALISNLCQGA